MAREWKFVWILMGVGLIFVVFYPVFAREFREQKHARLLIKKIFFRVEKRNGGAVLWAIPQHERGFIKIWPRNQQRFECFQKERKATALPVKVGSIFVIGDRRHWSHHYRVQKIDEAGVEVEIQRRSIFGGWPSRQITIR